MDLLVAAVALWLYLRDQALRGLRAKLRAACRRGDARGARDALVEWGKAAGAPAVLDPERASALDAALYAGRAWDGKAFWRAARPCLAKPKKRRAAPKAPLPPLFKLQDQPSKKMAPVGRTGPDSRTRERGKGKSRTHGTIRKAS